MRTVACDWDDTLVDARTQEWLPGAQNALAQLANLFDKVIVWTCHANWPEGRATVEAKLAEVFGVFLVEQKPAADVYIDDKAVRFTGDWQATLEHVEAGSSPRPERHPTNTGPQKAWKLPTPAVTPRAMVRNTFPTRSR